MRERQFTSLPDNERLKLQALNIAVQLGMMTKAEKEKLASEPRKENVQSLKVSARNERRA